MMPNQRLWKFEKAQVLERLKKNMEGHREKVEKIWQVYQEKVTKELERQLERARKGKKIRQNFLWEYPIPKDYTQEYERVIDMIESSLGSEVELTEGEFKNYMRDEWNWTEEFKTTSSNYIQV